MQKLSRFLAAIALGPSNVRVKCPPADTAGALKRALTCTRELFRRHGHKIAPDVFDVLYAKKIRVKIEGASPELEEAVAANAAQLGHHADTCTRQQPF